MYQVHPVGMGATVDEYAGLLTSVIGSGGATSTKVIDHVLDRPDMKKMVADADATVLQAKTLLLILGVVALGVGAAYAYGRVRTARRPNPRPRRRRRR